MGAIFSKCFCSPRAERETQPTLKSVSSVSSISSGKAEDVADEVIQIMTTAEKPGPALQSRIRNVIETEGWTEDIAKAILAKLQQVIEAGQSGTGTVLQDAIDTASEIVKDVFQFATDHPVAMGIFCTLVAIGVLVLIAPWVVEALGFGELGPLEGSFAAWWQSTYRGYVSKESLFAFFQRLGMTWR